MRNDREIQAIEAGVGVASVSGAGLAGAERVARRALPGELFVVNTVVGLARWMSPSLAKTARIEKRSDAWPFEALLVRARADARALAPPEEVEKIEARAREVRRRLRGVVRTTTFGKGVARAEAAGVCKRVSSPRQGMALLYALTEIYRPSWVVEFGSAFGVGSAALALGMLAHRRSGARTDARMRFDGVEYEACRAKIADEGVREILGEGARVHAGDIFEVLPRIAKDAAASPGAGARKIDLAFVDAEHTYEATVGYHRALLPLLAPGAIVAYDDTEWSEGMKRAWRTIVEDARVTDALSLGKRWGIVRVS